MKTVIVLLADGFEEMEAVIPIDLMRRAGISVLTVSMNETLLVCGSRNIVIEADVTHNSITEDYFTKQMPDALFIPGGLNGSKNLAEHSLTKKVITTMFENKKIVAVMCAAPIVVLAPLGFLDGKQFTCYPGMEKEAEYVCDADISGHKTERIVMDGNLLTSQGPGSASECAFVLIELLRNAAISNEVKKGALFI